LKGILPFLSSNLLLQSRHLDRLFSNFTSNAFQLSQ
jgi:hypothetical protein